MPSLREVTREQFANGTTVDGGTRLERALADLIARFNRLRPRDMRRRWFPAIYTSGYMPSALDVLGVAVQQRAPWLSVANVTGITVANPPPLGLQNTWRNKGLRNVLIDPDTGVGDQLAWTTAFYFGKPVIVTGVSLHLGTDGVQFTNGFAYTAAAPAPKTSLPADDVVVELAVDNPWTGHDALSGAQAFLRTQFNLQHHLFNPVGTAPGGFVDGAPAFASNVLYAAARKNPEGVIYWQPDLNLPLPGKSTARLSFIIPQYDDPLWSSWGAFPWRTQYCAWTLHVLEAAE